jgi:VWFA-related protein
LTGKGEETSLDFVVHDKKQRSVLDLKPEEIAVMDDGEAVKLTSLHLVNSAEENGHLITLVFDHLSPTVKKNASEVAGKILKLVPEGKFSLAVLKIEPGRLGLLQAFTPNRNALDQAVTAALAPDTSAGGNALEKAAEDRLMEVVKTGIDARGTHVSAMERTLARTMFDALRDSARSVQEQHAQSYLSELLALVGSQQKIAGRKGVIYFTQGNHTDSSGKEVMRSIIGAANRADVSIYTVDLTAFSRAAAGTDPGPLSDMMALSQLHTAYGQATLPPTDENYFSQRSLLLGAANFHDRSPGQELAEGTGGSYIDGTSDLQKPLQRMIRDMTTYYEAFYLPTLKEYDGKFRSVAVRPLRKGVKIQCREGYFAIPPDATSSIRPFELPLLNILSRAQLPEDLRFRAAILRLGNLPNRDGNILAIEVPLSGVEMRQDANTDLYSAQLAIVAQIKDKAGTVLEKFSEDIPYRGALEQVQKAKSQVVTLQRHFDVPPGEYVIEVASQDRLAGKVGAQRIPFEIAEESGGPSLSDMVLVRRIEPFHAETDPLEPLWHGNEKVTANLSGEAARDEKHASVFFITHPDPNSSEDATLNIQMMKDGRSLEGMPAAFRRITGKQAASQLATFPITSLPDGSYEMRATLSQGGKTSSTTTSFRLGGSLSPRLATEASNADFVAPAVEEGFGDPPAIQFSTGSVQPPPKDQIKSVLADATERAIRYGLSLPNFICTQVTSRSIDSDGDGKWKHQDTFTVRLTYVDNVEKRTILAVNGQATSASPEQMMGVQSEGELGGVLKSVFQPSSKTDFQWKESGTLGPGIVQVFDYRVSREHSAFVLARGVTGDQEVITSFHGEIFIDNATHSVRRVTMVADDLPKTFFIQDSSVAVDYDYIGIDGHDFLLPVGAQVRLRQRGHRVMLNEIEFRDYRRFGSKVKITPVPQSTSTRTTIHVPQ